MNVLKELQKQIKEYEDKEIKYREFVNQLQLLWIENNKTCNNEIQNKQQCHWI